MKRTKHTIVLQASTGHIYDLLYNKAELAAITKSRLDSCRIYLQAI